LKRQNLRFAEARQSLCRDDKIAFGDLDKGGGHNDWRALTGFFCFRRRPLSGKPDASCSKSKNLRFAEARQSLCRDDKIRTCDPLHPMQVRYRAALRPENDKFRGCEGKEKIHFWLKNVLSTGFLRFNFSFTDFFSIIGAILAFRKATSTMKLS
jgi:hypothetical protein